MPADPKRGTPRPAPAPRTPAPPPAPRARHIPADPTREAPRPAAAPSTAARPAAAETAKAALRRLALSKLEPTPENYARAWAEEGGASPPAAEAPAPASPRAKAV